MKFGLMYEMSPRPDTEGAEYKVFHDALAQVRLADRLGFGYVWIVEHHFLEELSVSSAPDLFLTACAMQTEQIRLGHGIVICVPEINHPIRLAERAATLDILSNGRLEFGTGRSSTWTELHGFQANPDKTKESWDEYVRTIPQMWTQKRFRYSGSSFSMPERAVIPKPHQKPHPPMWVAVASKGTEYDAADRGLGALVLSLSAIDEQRAKVEAYRERIKTCTPVGAFVNNKVALVNIMFCHKDADVGVSTGLRLARKFREATSQHLSVREAFPSPSYTRDATEWKRRFATLETGDKPPGLCIGTPEMIIDALKLWESIGIDIINFQLNIADEVPQEEIMASIELFGREVLPYFENGQRGSEASAHLVASATAGAN